MRSIPVFLLLVLPAAPSEKNALLPKELAQCFHRSTAKLLYLCARARRDIRTAVAFLTTRVRAPCSDDWAKLRRVLRYLYRNPGLPLTLRADNIEVIQWWGDASFAVHPDMKSHTGGTMSLGKGSVIDICRKQKFNTRSSTKTELAGVDDCIGKMIWAKHFLQHPSPEAAPGNWRRVQESQLGQRGSS